MLIPCFNFKIIVYDILINYNKKGKICLPFVDTEWKSDSSNFDITNAIYNMIHGEPKPNDSANMTICEIYKKDPN